MNTDKRGFEFSFAWLFAIIVGAVILFLALYFSTGIIRGTSYQRDTEIAKELTLLFDPFATGFAETKIDTITLPVETRVLNACSTKGVFGSQLISSSQHSLGKWSEPGGEIAVNNRYVFSREIEDGKKFFLFSKNFEMPFKASEIIILSSGKYCFKNMPDHVEDALRNLNLEDIEIGNCSFGSVTVCPSSGCDVQVADLCRTGIFCEREYNYGYVMRKGSTKKMYYSGNLLYSAIFSDPDIYECNVKRLAQKITELSKLYRDQNAFNDFCGTTLEAPLLQLAQNAQSLRGSVDLASLLDDARAVREVHDGLQEDCRVWAR